MQGENLGVGPEKVAEIASALSRMASELGREQHLLSTLCSSRVDEWEDAGVFAGSDGEGGFASEKALFDDSHLFDEACALCQKCQMRKRLERRRQGRVVEVAAEETWTEDSRKLEDLLDFIGEEGPQDDSYRSGGGGKGGSKRGGRRKKKVDAGAPRGSRAGCPLSDMGTRSDTSADASEDRSTVDCNAKPQGTPRASSDRSGDDLDRLSLSSIPSRDEDEEGKQRLFQSFADGEDPLEGLTNEERDALDREVEEFRRRLASVAVPVGGRPRPIISFDRRDCLK